MYSALANRVKEDVEDIHSTGVRTVLLLVHYVHLGHEHRLRFIEVARFHRLSLICESVL